MYGVIVKKNGSCDLINTDFYEKTEGETLLEEKKHLDEIKGKVKPVYNEEKDLIEEKSSKKEVDDFYFPNGKPIAVETTKTNSELEEELTLTQMAVAEGYEENLLLKEELKKTNALLDVASGAIVDIYETILLGGE